MGFKSNAIIKFFIYSSIIVFLIKLYSEKIYESNQYKDSLKFYVSKIPMKEENIQNLNYLLDSYLEEIILFTGFSCILSIFGSKIFSIIACLIYLFLSITNYMIQNKIFTFNFYHISQEFLLLCAPSILIPLTELNLFFSKNVVIDTVK